MKLTSKAALAAAVLALSTFAAAAQTDRLPIIDMEKQCHNRAKASQELMGDKTVPAGLYERCLKSEQDAKAALVKAWKDVPAKYRTMCIRPNEHSPSYVEWIACLEMNIGAKNLRSKI
jgi:hypothetical protein